jgi:hypothetical protein
MVRVDDIVARLEGALDGADLVIGVRVLDRCLWDFFLL